MTNRPTELKDTVEQMLSDDFKERFKAEYTQLRIRRRKLDNLIDDALNDTLTFTPACSIELLMSQVAAMDTYLLILRERARIEHIEL